jgi:alkylhydroperoxidase family enzyme
MPWIDQVPIEESAGLLREQFDAAVERAGRVWHIVHVMSVNPEALRDSMTFYLTIMKGDSPLSRVQREMLATVVSAELECHY